LNRLAALRLVFSLGIALLLFVMAAGGFRWKRFSGPEHHFF
jgi:hypothetical protein